MKLNAKSKNLYFILLLIAIITFACVSFKKNISLEGFVDAQNAQDKFDKSCIQSCEKEAKLDGISDSNQKCKTSCDKITKKCHYKAFNSPEWWNCLKNINSNVVIPEYILNNSSGKNNIPNNSINNSNFDNDMEKYLNSISNSVNDNEINKLKKENKKLKLLQKQFDKNTDMSNTYSDNRISRNQIPFGDEDKYILKSEIIPPICPACPTLNCGNCKTKCPPCPSCARCPEPAFKCEKVPNYEAGLTNKYLPSPWTRGSSNSRSHNKNSLLNGSSNYETQNDVPMPRLNDFSQF